MQLPPFVQPPKPEHFDGMDALEKLALRPEQHRANTLLLTANFVVAYDLYPKAAVHLLILPRGSRMKGAALSHAIDRMPRVV